MLNDLKDLEKFFKICRKKGVTEITVDQVSVKFGDLPTDSAIQAEEADEIPTDALSPDELIYYAVQNAGQA